jgi:hypothetical protein
MGAVPRILSGLHDECAEKLCGLGFSSADVEDALAVAVAQDGLPSLETALDWLCLNVPEDDLPTAFAAGVDITPPELAFHWLSTQVLS